MNKQKILDELLSAKGFVKLLLDPCPFFSEVVDLSIIDQTELFDYLITILTLDIEEQKQLKEHAAKQKRWREQATKERAP